MQSYIGIYTRDVFSVNLPFIYICFCRRCSLQRNHMHRMGWAVKNVTCVYVLIHCMKWWKDCPDLVKPLSSFLLWYYWLQHSFKSLICLIVVLNLLWPVIFSCVIVVTCCILLAGVRRLVVVEAGSKRVEGIISLSDIFKFLLG